MTQPSSGEEVQIKSSTPLTSEQVLSNSEILTNAIIERMNYPTEIADGIDCLVRMYLDAIASKDYEQAEKYRAAHERWLHMFENKVLGNE